MASGKLSPRQKMINMMYLVLTALLAMNVSKEILNSFAILNSGLVKTNENFTIKNEAIYNNFQKAMLTDKIKTGPYYNKALAVKKRSQEMFDYIEKLKNELIKKVEKKEMTEVRARNGQDSLVRIASNILYMEGKDDYQSPTYFFMGDKDNAVPGNRAYEFKDKVQKFRKDMTMIIPIEDRKNIKLGLETGDIFSPAEDLMVSWENNNFYHNPAVAAIAILSKMQNDVKNAEADIINALYNRLSIDTYKFDKLAARVNPNSNYVLIGDEYKAEIFAAGISTTSNPDIWLGDYDTISKTFRGPIDSTSVKVQNGIGIYSISPESEGTTDLKGIIRVKNPANPGAPPDIFPFQSQYQSARPAIVAAPTGMNVFYRGLENPLAVSVPGIAAEDLVVGISGGGGKITKKANGEYIVNVSSGNNCFINVSAKMKDGTVRPMGKGIEFRVRQVPTPVTEVFGKRNSAKINQAEVASIKKVFAKLDDFILNVPYNVVSFEVSTVVNNKYVTIPAKGNSVTAEQAELIKNVKKGNAITIENVKVQRPDKTIVDAGNVILKVM